MSRQLSDRLDRVQQRNIGHQRALSKKPAMTQLEPRVFFASVTLITHGYEPTGVASGWITALGNALSARAGGGSGAGAGGGADIYRLTITGTGANANVAFFVPVSVASGTPRGDAVVLLDWAASSSVNFLSLSASTSSTQIARLVAPQLLTAHSNFGARTTPLAELPIHLIGHSRGASVVSELAKALGEQGVWVDQVTTLDPRPVPPDPSVRSWSNVLFADNYYEQVDSSIILDGSSVSGAANVNLSGVFGNLTGLGQAHNAVPTYYGGTANTAASSFAGVSIDPGWYATSTTGPRESTGFTFSAGLAGAGATPRPLSGLRFAGGADRSSLTVTAAGADRWDNVNVTSPSAPATVAQGTGLNVSFRLEDINRDATTTYFLDTDATPYNGMGVPAPLATSPPAASTTGATAYQTTLSTTGLPVGNYYLAAKITSAAHTRYDYSLFPITVVPEGTTTPTQVLTLTRARPVSYLDQSGRKVTVRLTGPGTGTLVLPVASVLSNAGGKVLVSATGAPSLSVVGTTAGSSVSVVTPARTTTAFSSITLSSPLATLSAPTTDLTTGLTSQSSLRTLSLHDLTGATVTLAQGVNNATFNDVSSAKVLAGFTPDSTPANYTVANAVAVFRSLTVRGLFSDSLIASPTLPVTRLTSLDTTKPSTLLTQNHPSARTIFVRGRAQQPNALASGLELSVVSANV